MTLNKAINDFRYNISCGYSPMEAMGNVLYHTELKGRALYNLKQFFKNNVNKYTYCKEQGFWYFKGKYQTRHTYKV